MMSPISTLTLMCLLSREACKTKDAQEYAAAVDAETDHEGLRSLLAVYGWKESTFLKHPRGESWDARAGVSCGLLQMPCTYVVSHTTREQVHQWLTWVFASSLGSVDSDPDRAAHRAARAERLLLKAKTQATN